jgi:hypothetical protein
VVVTGYNFEEAALAKIWERADRAYGYAADIRPDIQVCLTALDAILARHHRSKLAYADGYVCAVCYDKPWPCPDRAAIREALVSVRRMAADSGYTPSLGCDHARVRDDIGDERAAMPTRSDAQPLEVAEASREEGIEILDAAARQALGISGEEFLRRKDAGEYEESEDPAVARVAMLIPFAR